MAPITDKVQGLGGDKVGLNQAFTPCFCDASASAHPNLHYQTRIIPEQHTNRGKRGLFFPLTLFIEKRTSFNSISLKTFKMYPF